MEIQSKAADFSGIDSAAVILGVFENQTSEVSGKFQDQCNLSADLQKLSFSGKYKETAIVPCDGKIRVVVAVGFGESEKFSYDRLRNAFAKGLKAANGIKAKNVAMLAPGKLDSDREQLEMAFTSVISLYDFDKFKTKKKEKYISSLTVLSENPSGESIRTGKILGNAMNLTRDLANMPASSGTPTHFETVAKEIPGVKLTVFNREQINEMGMGGIEAVSRGAHEPPKLIVMEYNNGGNAKPLMFVGKGITFDSGGISLKPKDNLFNLKFDKSGASAVMGAMKAISELGLKVNVVSLMPLTENLPGGGAYKPGDIITHYNGVTSEVISTDAEGRLVLADSMSYGAVKYDPSAIVDIATLTGAKLVALGNNIAAIFSNEKNLENIIMKCAERSWERLWPLPLTDEFEEQIRSDVADIKNSGGMPGGAETAAAFLSHFTGGKPWVHLDVQGRTVSTNGPSNREYLTTGASAFGARLLVEVAMEYEIKGN